MHALLITSLEEPQGRLQILLNHNPSQSEDGRHGGLMGFHGLKAGVGLRSLLPASDRSVECIASASAGYYAFRQLERNSILCVARIRRPVPSR